MESMFILVPISIIIELFFDDVPVGSLRNEYLTVSGQTFVLTDLTGAM